MINIALFGCGGFVRHTHMANLLADDRFHIYATVDTDLAAAQNIAEECGAAYWTDDADRALSDPNVNLVFIVTPHHTHADLSIRAAEAGKHIFCEKPMGLNEEECSAVAVCQAKVQYMIGHNRAVAPFILQANELLRRLQAPMLVYHRIADWNPYNRGWLLDEALSGGRVIGEGSHAVDMICQLAGQDPVRVYAEGGNFAEPNPTTSPDSAIITLGFPDESSGVVFLSSVANNAFAKEEVQITCANHTVVITNFQHMHIYAPEGKQGVSLPAADKGHRTELDYLARAILEGITTPQGVQEGLRAAHCTFAAIRSIRTQKLQWL